MPLCRERRRTAASVWRSASFCSRTPQSVSSGEMESSDVGDARHFLRRRQHHRSFADGRGELAAAERVERFDKRRLRILPLGRERPCEPASRARMPPRQAAQETRTSLDDSHAHRADRRHADALATVQRPGIRRVAETFEQNNSRKSTTSCSSGPGTAARPPCCRRRNTPGRPSDVPPRSPRHVPAALAGARSGQAPCAATSIRQSPGSR